jgi:hypothetical protein
MELVVRSAASDASGHRSADPTRASQQPAGMAGIMSPQRAVSARQAVRREGCPGGTGGVPTIR